jgi:hypothetical protein
MNGQSASTPKVYIAGPYTNGDVDKNVLLALQKWHELWDLGYVPYVPHTCHFMDQVKSLPYNDWIQYDLIWLETCDVLLRMPGFSKGADGEVELAEKLGIPVVHNIKKLQSLYPLNSTELEVELSPVGLATLRELQRKKEEREFTLSDSQEGLIQKAKRRSKEML